MTSGLKTLEQIHRELWEIGRQEEPFNQLEPKQITKTIKHNAGLDERTVEKYWEELKSLDKIEEIPKLGRWKINEPEKKEVEDTGKAARKNVRVDKGLKQAAESLGLNFTVLLNKALAEEISGLKEYVNQLNGDSLSEQESEYAFELVTHELYKKKGSKKAEAKIDAQRRNMYKDIFNKDEITSEDYDHLENLRLKAWDIAESLGIENPA